MVIMHKEGSYNHRYIWCPDIRYKVGREEGHRSNPWGHTFKDYSEMSGMEGINKNVAKEKKRTEIRGKLELTV